MTQQPDDDDLDQDEHDELADPDTEDDPEEPPDPIDFEQLIEGLLQVIEKRGWTGDDVRLIWAGVADLMREQDRQQPQPWATIELPDPDPPDDEEPPPDP